MRARIFVVVWVASLILMIATVMVWVRSSRHIDWVGYTNARYGAIAILTQRGEISLGTRNVFASDASHFYHLGYDIDRPYFFSDLKGTTFDNVATHITSLIGNNIAEEDPDDWLRDDSPDGGLNHGPLWLGFGYASTDHRDPDSGMKVFTGRVVVGPLWLLVGMFLLLPLRAGTIHVRKWRRRKNSRCLGCGYDLRFSKERCPECGRPVETDIERQKRIRADRRMFLAILFLFVAGAGTFLIAKAVERIKILQWQRQCATWKADPVRIIYSNDHASINEPAPVCWGKFQVALLLAHPSDQIIMGLGWAHDPSLPQSPILMTELQCPGGQSRLVVVNAGSQFDLWATVIKPASFFHSPAIIFEKNASILQPDQTEAGMTFFPGERDAADPSHFIIHYKENGLPCVIDGWLQGDDSVRWGSRVYR